MKIKKNCLALIIGFFTSSGCIQVHTQEIISSKQIEEVVVTGIRAGLNNAVNTKRNADALMDAVSAEDIGKFPDNDVAESLARIPGISVNRQFGQGQQVSIRGASNNLTLTTLNGQSVASTGWYDQQAIDRSFNYTLLPPEMIAGIEVYKSSRADLVEGGVGGTVNVRTRKPLDLEANVAFSSVEYDYGTVSEKAAPGISGLYSWKNTNNTLGILASIAIQDTQYVRNGTESLYDWEGSVFVNAFKQDRARTSYDIATQFRPTDNIQFGVHYINMEMEADNTNTSVFFFQDVSPDNCDQPTADGTTCVLATMDDSNPASAPFLQTFSRAANMESKTLDMDFSLEGESYFLSIRTGKTEASGGTDLTVAFTSRIGYPSDTYGTFDARGEQVKLSLANPRWTVADVQGDVGPSGWVENGQPNTDEEVYFQADLNLEIDFGVISSIKTGFRWTNHDVTAESNNAIYDNPIVTSNPNRFWNGTVSAGMQGYQIPDADFDAMQNEAKLQISRFIRNRSGYGAVSEENTAFYVMASFDAQRIRGNFGLRYIQTDAASDYYGGDPGHVDPDGFSQNDNVSMELSTGKSDYSEILPSLNIVFDLTDELILRSSAAQVISRPNYNDMFLRSSFGGLGDANPVNQSVSTGSVALKPFKANQADLALEWYYGTGNLASMTYFVKDVSNFTTFTSKTGQSIGLIDPICHCDEWTVTTNVNGDGGNINGVELQLQQGFANGFGTVLNYTYANTNSNKKNFVDLIGIFSDSSEHTFNLMTYFESDTFSARAAYNWRSEYMIREIGFYGNRMHDDYGTLDISLSYQVTESIGISLNAVNVLKEDSVQTGVAPSDADIKAVLKNSYPAWTYEGEARYILGVNVRF